MPKTNISIKDAANAGTAVFNQIANGNTLPTTKNPKEESSEKDRQTPPRKQGAKDTEDAQNTQDAKDVQNTKATKKEAVPMARLNLKIPADIKEYLTVAAALESIKKKRQISLTEYLCDIVRADRDKNK